MSKFEKTLLKILSGFSDKDIYFSELCGMLKYPGFKEWIKGSHHIFFKESIEEILNI